MRKTIAFLLFVAMLASLPRPGWAQSTGSLSFRDNAASVHCMPDCNTVNPYPGLGSDGWTGRSYVSPGRTYSDGYPTGSTSGYGTYDPGSGAVRSPSALSTLPLTTINASDFEEEFGSPLTPAGGAELYLSRMPTGKRTGVFQKGNFNALWTPKSGSDGVGMTQFDASLTFALPMLKPESPLIITPMFQAWLLDPKDDSFLSRMELYTTGVDFRWIKPVVPNKLTLDLGVSTLYSGTFHGKTKKAMRYPAHVVAIWNCNPRLKFVFGVAYLDREDDYNWIPMAGLIWTPHDDLSVELLAPRARIAQRVRWFGNAAGSDRSDWIYTAFEFGGGSWSETQDDITGTLDYRDFRALIGYERRTAFGMTLAFEVGYMFKRKYEFEVLNYYDKQKPGDNVFLRLRTSF